MQSERVFPTLGGVLRALVSAGGYRPKLAEIGLDKDLDDAAVESRGTSTASTLHHIEVEIQRVLESDAGPAWNHVFAWAWSRTRGALQQLVRDVDVSPLAAAQAHPILHAHFTIPMVASFLRLASTQMSGPDVKLWCAQPFATWVAYASESLGVPTNDLLLAIEHHLGVDARTLERWLSGDPIKCLRAPYRECVSAIAARPEPSIQLRQRLAGWLAVAVGFQSMAQEDRIAVGSAMNILDSWTLSQVTLRLSSLSLEAPDTVHKHRVVDLADELDDVFASAQVDLQSARTLLAAYGHLIASMSQRLRQAHRPIHDWLSARADALEGHEAPALDLYLSAVTRAWWSAGPNLERILREALLYAAGVNDVVAAKHLWDRCFVLGLNSWPKRDLDEQRLRQLSLGFEAHFGLQAKLRVPPRIEPIVTAGPYRVTPQELRSPNRKVKVKTAGGRVRRTPLMSAILLGRVEDVRSLLHAEADPNDFIPESGEGALSYAMRRACDRHQPEIMELLLQLELTKETVNRPASMQRETPLKLAIDMGSPPAVARLIQLGADVEARTGHAASALVHALSMFSLSVTRGGREQAAYLQGQTPGDVHDAKDGAVLDVDIAARRRSLAHMRHPPDAGHELFAKVFDHFVRPAAQYASVISTLLRHGADPNRSYKVRPGDRDTWTPTLLAAEVGDVTVFQELLKAGGDPHRTLVPGHALHAQDALWIALAYGRREIVDFLRTYGPVWRA